ncbi:methyltransferase domain-containing protein [Synechococcus sp. CS-197]|uniref:class I SAM-dependent methyltransferase n=1 Tax=Synechococcus sp. CS-197 TaxID=2847985 RepID=UPI0001525B8D|nr:methyltransferase domain-containing protein [Synechococcus sp. CS-197]MCT0250810.1 methyltransferase domain-containing protein [Synechococcus sp. CS-197]CAK22517.1 Conserved hypothetical protein [Synechococcus sp. WH 7803]
MNLNTKKIHLGCGNHHLSGFINVDARQTDATDLVCDMNHLPFQKNSLDVVYMCHSLEHIGLTEVGGFVQKIYTLLAPGGQFYVSVPNFEVLASLYLSNKCPLSMIVRAIHGGQEYPENTHYMSYDQILLTQILKSAGFAEVKQYLPMNFLPAGFSDTSTYEIAGKQISLNLCATK